MPANFRIDPGDTMKPFLVSVIVLFSFLATVLYGNEMLKNLPPDTWTKIPNTKMRSVCTTEAQFPQAQGVGGCTMVMDAWSGGTYESAKKRVWIWGGGHADYYGNELYAFDIESLKWTRITDPSPVTTAGLSQDPMPNGEPVSRHTYDGLAFLDHAGLFFAYGGSMGGNGYGTQVTWVFNPVTKKWTNQNPSGSVNRPGTNCCNFMGEYDPISRKVYMRDPNWLCAYDYDNNSWTRLKSWEHSWDPGKAVIDTKRHLFITLGSKEFLVYDISANKDVTPQWKTMGGDAIINGYGIGAAYDKKSDQIVGWAGGAVQVLNMETKTWVIKSSQGAPLKPIPQGTYGRFRYIPDDNVFVLINGVDEDVHFYKLTSGGGTPSENTTKIRIKKSEKPRSMRKHKIGVDGRKHTQGFFPIPPKLGAEGSL
jgi:hypothetical protein